MELFMLRRIYAKLLVVSLCFVLFTSVINDFTQTVEAASSTPKNIIFMIGDGMGPNQILMAEQAKGSPLHMQNMPYKGVHSTSTVTGAVTDSAAAATALACGVKTIEGFVGVNRNGQPLPNIREYCADLGKKTGLVTNTSITDATPAGFGAHTLSRTNHVDIAEQYIQKEIDLLIGGGAMHFNTDLRNTATQKGYTVITQKTNL
jgi:alkaline phosphatase